MEAFTLMPEDIASVRFVKKNTKVYDLCVEDNHNYVLDCQKKIVVHNSGKTFDVIDYFIDYLLQGEHNAGVFRRHKEHVKNTYDNFVLRLKDYGDGVNSVIQQRVSPRMLVNKINGRKIYFDGLDNPENSVKGMTDLDLAWIDEASEADYGRFTTLNNTIRQSSKAKLILSLNAVSVNNWVKMQLFDKGFKFDKLHTTVLDNAFIDESYIEKLRSLKDTNETQYNVDFLGLWGVNSELIYFNHIDRIDALPAGCTYVSSGVDFGDNDPTVVCGSYIKDGDLYAVPVLYQSSLPISSGDAEQRTLVSILKDEPDNMVYLCDDENKSAIRTMKSHGIKATTALKGKGSILEGIGKIKQFRKVYVVGKGELADIAHTELTNYHRKKDKNENIFDSPADGQSDHFVDALRYSLSRSVIK